MYQLIKTDYNTLGRDGALNIDTKISVSYNDNVRQCTLTIVEGFVKHPISNWLVT